VSSGRRRRCRTKRDHQPRLVLRVPAFGVAVTGGRRAVLLALLLLAVVLAVGVLVHVFLWSLPVAALVVGV